MLIHYDARSTKHQSVRVLCPLLPILFNIIFWFFPLTKTLWTVTWVSRFQSVILYPQAGDFTQYSMKGVTNTKLTLEQALKVQRRLQVWSYSFFNLGVDGVGGQRHALASLPPGKDPVPIV
jgi:hypothetical protein